MATLVPTSTGDAMLPRIVVIIDDTAGFRDSTAIFSLLREYRVDGNVSILSADLNEDRLAGLARRCGRIDNIKIVAQAPSYPLLDLFPAGDPKAWQDLPRRSASVRCAPRAASVRRTPVTRPHRAPAARGRWEHHVAHRRRS